MVVVVVVVGGGVIGHFPSPPLPDASYGPAVGFLSRSLKLFLRCNIFTAVCSSPPTKNSLISWLRLYVVHFGVS